MRPNPLNQETNANDLSDSKSVAGFEVNENFDDPIINQLFTLFTTNAKEKT